jgi:hypothetical protein
MRADDEKGIDAAGDATAEPRPESSPSRDEDMREALNHLIRHQQDSDGTGEALSLRRRVFEETLQDSGYSQEVKDALREIPQDKCPSTTYRLGSNGPAVISVLSCIAASSWD